MRKTRKEINYQTLQKIGEIISSSRDMNTVAKRVVKALPEILEIKGAALMLLNRRSKELEVAASHGLSAFYLNKGPISSMKSIAESLSEGPVGIYNVRDDPRLQYPAEANREGIESILSVPLMMRGKPQGVLRLYTAEPWEFSMQDITFVQAIAQMLALVLENMRVAGAYKTSLELIKVLRPMIKARGRG
jgi:signal transduction protein with GAF and PtsI domain